MNSYILQSMVIDCTMEYPESLPDFPPSQSANLGEVYADMVKWLQNQRPLSRDHNDVPKDEKVDNVESIEWPKMSLDQKRKKLERLLPQMMGHGELQHHGNSIFDGGRPLFQHICQHSLKFGIRGFYPYDGGAKIRYGELDPNEKYLFNTISYVLFYIQIRRNKIRTIILQRMADEEIKRTEHDLYEFIDGEKILTPFSLYLLCKDMTPEKNDWDSLSFFEKSFWLTQREIFETRYGKSCIAKNIGEREKRIINRMRLDEKEISIDQVLDKVVTSNGDILEFRTSLGRKFYMSKNGEKVMVKIDGQKSQPMTIDDVKKILQKDEKIDYAETDDKEDEVSMEKIVDGLNK